MPEQTRARPLLRFLRDTRAVSAVEFALIAPVLIMVFVGAVTVGSFANVARHVNTVAFTIGNLATQTQTLHDADITDIFAVGNVVIAPMDASRLTMRLTSIQAVSVNNGPITDVIQWSDGQNITAKTVGTTVTLPTGLLTTAGDSVVLGEATYAFVSPTTMMFPDGLTITKQFYFRPRNSPTVTRTTP
jgi:Flp pilus assembly protein TadG